MLSSIVLKLGNYNVLLKLQVMKKLNVRSSGISSRIPNSALHLVFLDYDNIDDERLKEELTFLQEEFELGNFYVLKTREYGRHAICLDALRFKDVKEIVDFSSCDAMFKKAPWINEYRTWVLRYAKKGNRGEPKYVYKVESPHEGKNFQSRAHAKYLTKFGVTIDLKHPFGTEELETQDYNTGKRTDEEPEEAKD